MWETRSKGSCGGDVEALREALSAGSASHAVGRLVWPLIIESGMAAPDVP